MKLLCFLLIFISPKLYALGLNDIIKDVTVIKHYEDNYLVLNRGLEDGIYKGDHIKLTNTNGYIARAICIKTSMMLSHWKVYRIVNPELLSYDDSYKINSMNQSEIPEDLKSFRKADFRYRFNDISDEDLKKPIKMQQERIAEFDLSTDMSDHKAVIESKKSEGQKFVERNFSFNMFKSDLSVINAKFFSSTFNTQTRNDQKANNYGLKIFNNGKKYDYDFSYETMTITSVDQYTANEINSNQTQIQLNIVLKNISDNFSYFIHANQMSANTGEINFPTGQQQVGFIGFKYHVGATQKDRTIFDIGYIPLFENVNYDTINRTDSEVTITGSESESNIRHAFNLYYHSPMSESFFFDSNLWFKPKMDMKTQDFDIENNQLDWDTQISMHITKELHLTYQIQYLRDIRLKNLYGVNPSNQIQALRVSYLLH